MKLNPVTIENLPEVGELVWFCMDSSASTPVSKKGWIPALWLTSPIDLKRRGYIPRHQMVSAMFNGSIRSYCHISRFHIGKEPPSEDLE